ncbi:hypothetical protein RchiOBHm_Chr2g0130781 [Rosa chinensis]|uniref:Uncharacterized protein n=1 Tax=Rosa chinensis TaxID=74649 RepID=A0A2P6RUV5_ROSCH|nr:hypothetical protein RchiOBHm_Chr2g0130781 [Rosa chinensis]
MLLTGPWQFTFFDLSAPTLSWIGGLLMDVKIPQRLSAHGAAPLREVCLCKALTAPLGALFTADQPNFFTQYLSLLYKHIRIFRLIDFHFKIFGSHIILMCLVM